MKAAFATVALLVLASSWAGSEAVQVQVSTRVHTDRDLSQPVKESRLKGRASHPNPANIYPPASSSSALFAIFSSLQENGLTFSLEAVRRLQELAESSVPSGLASPRLRASTAPLCGDPLLPQEFLPLCRQRGASASMARLGETALTRRPSWRLET